MGVPGYKEEPLANKHQYNKFIRTFSDKVEKSKTGVSLIGFGTFFNSSCDVGRSDVDILTSFPQNIITNKLHFSEISDILKESLEETNFNSHYLNFIPVDEGSMKDGRLNPFDADYGLQKHKVLVGNFSPEDFSYHLPTVPNLHNFRHSLSKVRKALLFFPYQYSVDDNRAVNNFWGALDKVTGSTRLMMGGMISCDEVTGHRFDDDGIKSIFPLVDFIFYDHLKKLYKNPKDFVKLFDDETTMQSYIMTGLTFMESLGKAYLDYVDNNSTKS